MKRLKYACPFGGKQHPIYIAFGSVLAVMLGTLFSDDMDVAFMTFLMIVAPILTLLICFWIEQSLTEDEKELIAEAEMPLWEEATPELIARIKAEEDGKGSGLLLLLCLCGFLTAFVFLKAGFSQITVLIAGICVFIILAVFVYRRHVAAIWSEIDETAVFTNIEIHHMYDVRHTSRHGRGAFRTVREWYENYIVFYLPDGRYTLHNRHTFTSHPPVITVVRYRGLIRWMPH